MNIDEIANMMPGLRFCMKLTGQRWFWYMVLAALYLTYLYWRKEFRNHPYLYEDWIIYHIWSWL